MLLIADTSPLISFLLIEQLEILERLFPGFLIPPAVWQELDRHQEIRKHHAELHRLSRQIKEITCHFPISGIEQGESVLFQNLCELLSTEKRRTRIIIHNSVENINCGKRGTVRRWQPSHGFFMAEIA